MTFDNTLKLLDETFSAFVESKADDDTDMADCYWQDLRDFKNVYYLVTRGYTGAAARELDHMDTAPREAFVSSLADDGYDIGQLGYMA